MSDKYTVKKKFIEISSENIAFLLLGIHINIVYIVKNNSIKWIPILSIIFSLFNATATYYSFIRRRLR